MGLNTEQQKKNNFAAWRELKIQIIPHQNYELLKNNLKHFFFQTFFETFFFFFISIHCKQWFFQNISLNLFPDIIAPCKTLYFNKVFENELKGHFQPLCNACSGPYQAQFLPRFFFPLWLYFVLCLGSD